MNAMPNFHLAPVLIEQVNDVLDLYRQVTATEVPVHGDLTPALWLWFEAGQLRHSRAREAPHPQAVVASWHQGSRRAVTRSDFVDAVAMELQER